MSHTGCDNGCDELLLPLGGVNGVDFGEHSDGLSCWFVDVFHVFSHKAI